MSGLFKKQLLYCWRKKKKKVRYWDSGMVVCPLISSSLSTIRCELFFGIFEVDFLPKGWIIQGVLCIQHLSLIFRMQRHADAIFTDHYRKVLGQISARKILQTIIGKRLG